MQISINQKIADILSENPYLLLLFEHADVEPPFQDKTVRAMCGENGLNPELVLTLLNLYNGTTYIPKKPLTPSDTAFIVSYLNRSHDYYLNEIYPNILSLIRQMAERNDSKEMALVERFFIDYFNEVKEHLHYENSVVFPYVLSLCAQLLETDNKAQKLPYSVDEYKRTHTDIEEKLDDLRSLLIKYLPHKDDRIIRRNILLALAALEHDLNIHSRIEDLILIPLVSQMESQLKKKVL